MYYDCQKHNKTAIISLVRDYREVFDHFSIALASFEKNTENLFIGFVLFNKCDDENIWLSAKL
jgi:hypothetical protein